MMQFFRSCWDQLSLSRKYATLIVTAGLAMAGLGYVSLTSLLEPAFNSIEARENAEQEARARNAMTVLAQYLTNKTRDWAFWDSAYAYLMAPTEAFELETLQVQNYQNLKVDMISFVRFDGEVIWSKTIDPELGKMLPEETETFARMLSSGALFQRILSNQSVRTYVGLEHGIYALQTFWVYKSDGSETPQGFLAMAERLSESNVGEALRVQVHLNRQVGSELADEILARPERVFSRVLKDHIETSLGLTGPGGQLLGAIEFNTPRNVSAIGNRALSAAAIVMASNMLLLAVLLGLGIDRISAKRLRTLQGHMRDFHTKRAPIDDRLTRGSDEISSLARQFSVLTEELREAEDQLRSHSYVQGKADSIAGLIHNVRNIVAPLRVMHEKWIREERHLYLTNLARALQELDSAECTESLRRANLIRFVLAAARKTLTRRDIRLTKLQEAMDSIDQITAIVNSQDIDPTSKALIECVDLVELVRAESKRISTQFPNRLRISLPSQIPPVLGNRIQLSQVLTNVMVNAVEAMTAANLPRMELMIDAVVENDSSQVALRVKDNGEGVDPKNLPALFERGFSTRNYKSGGIGLHWSANSMRAMGGSLHLDSEGAGKGATAVLRLQSAVSAAHRAERLEHDP